MKIANYNVIDTVNSVRTVESIDFGAIRNELVEMLYSDLFAGFESFLRVYSVEDRPKYYLTDYELSESTVRHTHQLIEMRLSAKVVKNVPTEGMEQLNLILPTRVKGWGK